MFLLSPLLWVPLLPGPPCGAQGLAPVPGLPTSGPPPLRVSRLVPFLLPPVRSAPHSLEPSFISACLTDLLTDVLRGRWAPEGKTGPVGFVPQTYPPCVQNRVQHLFTIIPGHSPLASPAHGGRPGPAQPGITPKASGTLGRQSARGSSGPLLLEEGSAEGAERAEPPPPQQDAAGRPCGQGSPGGVSTFPSHTAEGGGAVAVAHLPLFASSAAAATC